MTDVVSRRAVLFDFDGTLGRSLPHWAAAYQESLRDHGIMMDYTEALRACFAHSASLEVQSLSDAERAIFRERVWQRVLERMTLVEKYPDLVETLHELRKGDFATAVVTNSRRGHVSPVLHRWEIAHSFDTVISIEDVSKGKPDPEPIHRAIEVVKASTATAWMIGDSLADINAGKAAGVRTIAFAPPENHEFVDPDVLRAASPTHVAHSYREVKEIILGR